MKCIRKKADLLAFNYKFYPQNNLELGEVFCPTNSEFIKIFLDIYVYGLKIGRLKVMKRMIKEGMILNKPRHYFIDSFWRSCYCTYFLSYYYVQYVLQIHYKNETNTILKRAEDYIFKLQRECKWNYDLINKKLEEENGLDEYRIVKFTGRNRKHLSVYFMN